MCIMQQWLNMGEDAQIRMITANVRKAAKNEIAYSIGGQYNQYNEAVAWFMDYHGLECLVNETWLKLAERLTPEYLDGLNSKRTHDGKEEITLISLVYRCAKDAIRCIYEQDIKHGRAQAYTIVDNHGDEYDYIDIMAVSARDNTETSAIIRAAFRSILNGMDNTDRIIIECKCEGMSEREIGAVTGISCAAVHKRIVKIRAALTAILVA